jgi:uroporphyrinogen decarboxylase
MDGRERVRRALTCRTPDRVPKALAFFPQALSTLGSTSPEDAFGLDVCYAYCQRPPAQDDFIAYLRGLPPDVHVGTPDQLRTYHEWRYHPERGDTGRLDDGALAAGLPGAFPDPLDASQLAALAAQVQAGHRAGRAVAAAPPHLGGELFETAWRLRGFRTFLTDRVERPALARYLLEQLTALTAQNAVLLARAGIDVLLLDDDIAMPTGLIIGEKHWRQFFKPCLGEIIRQARAIAPDLLVMFHSDGDFTRVVPDLVEIGVNAINPLQPDCMDAAAIKYAFGDRLALWGTAGTATLWDWGTPAQLRAEAERCVRAYGPAGLLLAPAYDVDFTPLANLRAFFAAVDTIR